MNTTSPETGANRPRRQRKHAPDFNAIAHQTAEHHLRSNWDTDIRTPSDGQVLTYRASDKRWHPASAAAAFSGASCQLSPDGAVANVHVSGGTYKDSHADLQPYVAVAYDTDSYFGSTGRVTIPSDGYYRFTAHAYVIDIDAGGPVTGQQWLYPSASASTPAANGFSAVYDFWAFSNSQDCTLCLSFTVKMAAGATMDFQFGNDSAGDVDFSQMEVQVEKLGSY